MLQLTAISASQNIDCHWCGNLASIGIVTEHKNEFNKYETNRIALCDRCRHMLSYDLNKFPQKQQEQTVIETTSDVVETKEEIVIRYTMNTLALPHDAKITEAAGEAEYRMRAILTPRQYDVMLIVNMLKEIDPQYNDPFQPRITFTNQDDSDIVGFIEECSDKFYEYRQSKMLNIV